MPQVDILLSIYNGQDYILDLLESLSKQDFNDFHLIIRTDGSQDESLDLVKSYLAKQEDFKTTILPDSNNLGVIKSFEKLMQSSTADYVMFCDQDDVWLPNKISVSLEAMKKAEKENPTGALLVHSDLHLVGQDLKTIHPSMWEYQKLDAHKGVRLNRALMQNTVTGCTMMVNRQLLDLVVAFPKGTLMHDWYLALVASAFGKIIPINESLILYRQHGNNTVGGQKYGFKALLDRRKAEKKSPIKDACLQGNAFLEQFNDKLSPAQEKVLEAFTSLPFTALPIYSSTLLKNGFWKSGFLKNIALLIGIGR